VTLGIGLDGISVPEPDAFRLTRAGVPEAAAARKAVSTPVGHFG
jgi:hypothetical protein